MIPLLKQMINRFLFDEGAVVGWIRGFFLTCAAGGVAFADQVAEILGSPGAAKTIKIVALACGFVGGAIRAGDRNPPAGGGDGTQTPNK